MRKLFERLAAAFGARQTGETGVAPEPGGEEVPAAPFEPQNALERALALATDNPERRAEFHALLLESDLYAATPNPPSATADRVLQPGEQVSLLHVTAPNGESVPAFFTSEARVAEIFGADAGFLRANGRALLEIVVRAGAFLNPGLGYGVHWTAADLAAVLGRPARRVIEQPTSVLLGAPVDRPDQLIVEIDRALGSDPRIEEVWLALAHWSAGGERSWYLDVRTDLSPDEVNALMTGVYRQREPDRLPMDMIVNRPGGDAGIGIRIKPAETN
jgi:hypothetical protein